MQQPQNLLLLIEKYLAGTASPEDKRLLNEWYRSFNDSEAELELDENITEQQLDDRIRNRLLNTIHKDHPKVISRPYRKWQMLAAASVIGLIILAAGSYLIFSSGPANQQIVKKTNVEKKRKDDIAPGGNKAVLTLADGSSIILDSVSNGVIGQQGNIKVQKLDNGLLAYTVKGRRGSGDAEAFFNTISTPRGGQYQVTLSDGTKVWLNAASSIRFPVIFVGNERKVQITGEAYFEVTKNTAMPFKVVANSLEVEVLGTHFNVNAYEDETLVRTTLLEGSVKLTTPASPGIRSSTFLSPGQQATTNKEGKINVTDHADTEEAVAWMHGHFQFKSADLKTILRQIARWYDVDVEYQGNVDLHFSGQLTKTENVSTVFEKLALTGEVHFKIDGKRIIVSP